MHPVIQNILDRPKGQKVAIWVGVLAVLGFLFWQFFYSAKLTEKKELSDKAAELEKNIFDERRRAANLPKLREAVKELEKKLQVVLQELPDSSGIDRLIDSISDLARDAGLEITLFTRKEDNYQDFYAEVPVAISVEGSYHQVATFFDEVSHLDRIVNINQIGIGMPKISENSVSVKVDCNATTFRYLDEAERTRVAGKNDAANNAAKRKR
jgi:type IV pilus assembly protein PilO